MLGFKHILSSDPQIKRAPGSSALTWSSLTQKALEWRLGRCFGSRGKTVFLAVICRSLGSDTQISPAWFSKHLVDPANLIPKELNRFRLLEKVPIVLESYVCPHIITPNLSVKIFIVLWFILSLPGSEMNAMAADLPDSQRSSHGPSVVMRSWPNREMRTQQWPRYDCCYGIGLVIHSIFFYAIAAMTDIIMKWDF